MRILLVLIAVVTADVRLPPEITSQPESVIYEVGSTSEMHCEAEGVPEVEFSWQKDGKEFDRNRNNVEMLTDGSFKFTNLLKTDAGNYQCFPSNQYGVAMSEIAVLQEAVLGPFDILEEPIPYTATVGDPLVVPCHSPDSFPEPSYSWAIAENIGDQKPSELIPSKRVTIDLEGNLHFANVEGRDQMGTKIYLCRAYNAHTSITREGSESRITVNTGSPSQTKPVIQYKPNSKEVVVAGTTVSFQCLFSGYPTPEVRFTKVGEGGLSGNKKSKNFGTVMEIEKIVEKDAGKYECTGANSNGDTSYEFDIDVQVIPEFEEDSSQPHNMNKTEGDEVSFLCKTYGKPEATVQWYKNGKPIDSNDPGPRMSVTEEGKKLTIINLCKTCTGEGSDLMVVQCKASNVHGYAFGQGYLNVLSRTKLVRVPKDINMVDWDQEVVFPCEATSDDSTPVSIKWYFNDFEIDFNHEAYELIDGALHVDAVLLDNEEKDKAEGKYTCTADNGWSKASHDAFLTLPEDPAPQIKESSINWVLIVVIIVVVILLILLIVLICCVCRQRGMRDEYLVDEKEKKAGLDPEKELIDTGYHGYERPEARGFKGSQASLASHHSHESDSAFLTLPRGADAYA